MVSPISVGRSPGFPVSPPRVKQLSIPMCHTPYGWMSDVAGDQYVVDGVAIAVFHPPANRIAVAIASAVVIFFIFLLLLAFFLKNKGTIPGDIFEIYPPKRRLCLILKSQGHIFVSLCLCI